MPLSYACMHACDHRRVVEHMVHGYLRKNYLTGEMYTTHYMPEFIKYCQTICHDSTSRETASICRISLFWHGVVCIVRVITRDAVVTHDAAELDELWQAVCGIQVSRQVIFCACRHAAEMCQPLVAVQCMPPTAYLKKLRQARLAPRHKGGNAYHHTL